MVTDTLETDYEGRVLINGISPLQKRPQSTPLLLLPCAGTCETFYKLGSRASPDLEPDHVGTLISNLRPPER